MVLDTFDQERDLLIFKNTFDDVENDRPKHFVIGRDSPGAPKEFFFVHIEVQDIENLLPNDDAKYHNFKKKRRKKLPKIPKTVKTKKSI